MAGGARMATTGGISGPPGPGLAGCVSPERTVSTAVSPGVRMAAPGA
jgi:hypothetical protein